MSPENPGDSLDGDSHFRTAAAAYDEERTTHLKRFGIEVLGFTNLEVFENLEGVLHTIGDANTSQYSL